jgi:hypothetical protein
MKRLKKRKKQIEKDMEDAQQEKLLADEMEALQHIEQDVQKLQEYLRERRQHDLKPLLAKASMLSKMINAEERLGAVNPSILKQFQMYESSLIKKIEKNDMQSLKRDEFMAIEQYISDLQKERALLEKKYSSGNSRVKKRINETVAEELMLDNILRMASIVKLKDQKLKRNSIRLYDVLARIGRFEKEEEKVLEKA